MTLTPEGLAADCERQVENMARHLVKVADQILRDAGAFARGTRGGAVRNAADILNTVLQQTGKVGMYAEPLLRSAAALDVARAAGRHPTDVLRERAWDVISSVRDAAPRDEPCDAWAVVDALAEAGLLALGSGDGAA